MVTVAMTGGRRGTATRSTRGLYTSVGEGNARGQYHGYLSLTGAGPSAALTLHCRLPRLHRAGKGRSPCPITPDSHAATAEAWVFWDDDMAFFFFLLSLLALVHLLYNIFTFTCTLPHQRDVQTEPAGHGSTAGGQGALVSVWGLSNFYTYLRAAP